MHKYQVKRMFRCFTSLLHFIVENSSVSCQHKCLRKFKTVFYHININSNVESYLKREILFQDLQFIYFSFIILSTCQIEKSMEVCYLCLRLRLSIRTIWWSVLLRQRHNLRKIKCKLSTSNVLHCVVQSCTFTSDDVENVLKITTR